MAQSLSEKFEAKYNRWKKRLLDIDAGNRLISFRASKVSTVQITHPDCETLFEWKAGAWKSIQQQWRAGK
jgi:Protein of unknown function (DUF4011)